MDQQVSLDGMTRLRAAIQAATKTAHEHGEDATAAVLDDISADIASKPGLTTDLLPLHSMVGDP